jgi:hypothetical protein
MKKPLLVPTLAVLALCPLSAEAANWDKIDRTIAKQPIYESKAPKYCLLVFGAESMTRVWLVLDGELMYVDRNGNGDLTEDGKRFAGKREGRELVFDPATIVSIDGKRKYPLSRVTIGPDKANRQGIHSAFLGTADNQGMPQRLAGFVPFADRPQDAIVVPFDQDQLTLGVLDWHGAPNYLYRGGRLALNIPLDTSQRGVRPLSVLVGWPVPTLEGRAFVAVINQYKRLLGEKVLPAVEVEFPASDDVGKPLRVEAVVFH